MAGFKAEEKAARALEENQGDSKKVLGKPKDNLPDITKLPKPQVKFERKPIIPKKQPKKEEDEVPCDTAAAAADATKAADEALKQEDRIREETEKEERRLVDQVGKVFTKASEKHAKHMRAEHDIKSAKKKNEVAHKKVKRDELKAKASDAKDKLKKVKSDNKEQKRISEARARDKKRQVGEPLTPQEVKQQAAAAAASEEAGAKAGEAAARRLEENAGDSNKIAKAEAEKPDENVANQQPLEMAQKESELGDAFMAMAEANGEEEDSEEESDEEDGNQHVQLKKENTADNEEEGDADLIVNEMKDITQGTSGTKKLSQVKSQATLKTEEVTEKEIKEGNANNNATT